LTSSQLASLPAVLKRISFALAFLTITALLLGLLGRYVWPLDLFAHFRIHYIVALILAGIALLALREWNSGTIALLAAALASIPTFDYLSSASQHTSQAAPRLRVLSFNIWFRNEDVMRLAGHLDASGADIVMLQEISQQQAEALRATLKAYPFAYTDAAEPTDTVLLSRWPLQSTSTEKLAENGVSALRAIVQWRNTPVTVFGVHLHWPLGARSSTRRNAELKGLAALAATVKGPLIILGDLNVTPWSAHFAELLETSHLHDCSAGHGLHPTWPSQIATLGIRIDHCLASAHWQTQSTWTGPHIGSDHRPMFVEMGPIE
jgi:endonuclease/exonuclease/phosphatase (EEP) superfamily protein YafD